MHLKKLCFASFATQEYLSQGPGRNPFVMETSRRTAACVLVSVREEMLNPDGLQLVDTGGLIIEKNVGEPRSNSFCWIIHWPSSLPTALQFSLAHPNTFNLLFQFPPSQMSSGPSPHLQQSWIKSSLPCSTLQKFFALKYTTHYFFQLFLFLFVFSLIKCLVSTVREAIHCLQELWCRI